MSEQFLAAALKFKEEDGDQVIFGFSASDNMDWGDSEKYGPARPIADSEFKFDKRYWQIMGSPEVLFVGMSNGTDWEAYVGKTPPHVGAWMESVL